MEYCFKAEMDLREIQGRTKEWITQLLLLLFSHYADWDGPQPRLWFYKQAILSVV